MRLILLLLNIWLLLFVCSVASDHNLSRDGLGIPLIAFGVGFVSTLVHELGHAAAAWKVGYRVSRIAVFPFEFDFLSRRFSMAKTRPRSDVGGYVLAQFPTDVTRKGLLLYALGGPLAEALLAAALFISLALAEPSVSAVLLSDRAVEVITGLLRMLAIFAAGSCIINLVPIGGSDGHVILKVLRSSRANTSSTPS